MPSLGPCLIFCKIFQQLKSEIGVGGFAGGFQVFSRSELKRGYLVLADYLLGMKIVILESCLFGNPNKLKLK